MSNETPRIVQEAEQVVSNLYQQIEAERAAKRQELLRQGMAHVATLLSDPKERAKIEAHRRNPRVRRRLGLAPL